MKCIKHELNEDVKRISIEFFSDLHLGSAKCDYNLIKERIKRVSDDDNAYAVIMGDIINNTTKTSIGDIYDEPLSPMQQIKLAIETFSPIKNKILGITSGNHERRTYKQDGIDLLSFLASEFGLLNFYDYSAILIFIKFGKFGNDKSRKNGIKKFVYSIYCTHGDGNGGKTIGGKANGLQKRGNIINADLVVTGHTHSPFAFRDKTYAIDYANMTIAEREQVFINTSSCIDYENYAEIYGMKPNSKISPIVTLNGTKKEIIVNI